jgi:hypothetical protein
MAQSATTRVIAEAGGTDVYLNRMVCSMLRPTGSSPFKDEWDFLTRSVWTKDEATGSIRQFPHEERYDYLRQLTLIRKQHPIFAIEKSRRMLITWWMLSLYLFDTLTMKNHANFVVSKKLGDSAYLLGDDRILGVYKRIPESTWKNKPRLIESGKEERGFTLLTCPDTGSYLQAVASGADQLRQYTASNVFFDEFAFQDRQEDAWTAARPTIEGGGHIDMVSTPELGAFFYDLLYDTGRGV